MKNNQGIIVEDVTPNSPAHRAGIVRGDIILSINKRPVSDEIDYMFYGSESPLHLEIKRNNKVQGIGLAFRDKEDTGIRLRQFKIKICSNNCIFCFVSQMPRGLRKTLYIKDEDYRMSFIYGNYITMTNLTDKDKERIAAQRLSPLYISVHTTNRKLRNRMLGSSHAPDIMKELIFLKDNKIRMHCQIVLCPGFNDGIELKNTIGQLYSLYPYLNSIAVVPVGLTAHRKTSLKPVEKEDAEKALKIIEGFQKRFKKKHGDHIVYAADELYIKAEMPLPLLKDYGDLPQIENGVGGASLFSSKAKAIKVQKVVSESPHILSGKYITFTGISFYPYLKKFLERFEKRGVNITLVPVENSFFGKSITVTGLLTGRDVIKTLSGRAEGHDILLLPDIVLNESRVFLDDVSLKHIKEALGIEVKVIEPTPEGLIKGIVGEAK